jgi:hypothetical protein
MTLDHLLTVLNGRPLTLSRPGPDGGPRPRSRAAPRARPVRRGPRRHAPDAGQRVACHSVRDSHDGPFARPMGSLAQPR